VKAILTTTSLVLTAVSLLAAPLGGIIFTPFLFGLFLLSLTSVFDELGDRRVRQRDPALDGTSWRDTT
jgi:hypothetical protein